MAAIKIVSAPSGEAPLSIRQAWVGCILPLSNTSDSRRRRWLGLGVLSVKGTTWIAQLFAPKEHIVGYPVYVLDALQVLEAQNPEAAQWWRDNTPHLLKPRQRFLFNAACCEEVPFG